ncbi:MAG: prepilin-type N-terminal cleavage/methylation domain-containing protein [Verrucomicrobiae bacterium]|nr:prepilin-type N-terminal cleavage/methylation domain-containing protein [Verrucomicrobiae bacterium]
MKRLGCVQYESWRVIRAARRVRPSSACSSFALLPRGRGFTLIELIVVMALLATVLAVAAPSLSRFFRARTLDSEARRFIALTRYAQSRAVAEGVPMELWIDVERGVYGLRAESTYIEHDDKAVEFTLDTSLQIEVEPGQGQPRLVALPTQFDRKYVLRFTPDGFIHSSSPERVFIRQGATEVVVIQRSRTRLSYEIQPYMQLAQGR